MSELATVMDSVTPMPVAMEATPPAAVTRFHKKAAKSAGVIPAPTIVYAVNAIASTVVNCVSAR